MPSYILRHIDRDLWVRVKAHCVNVGRSPKDLIEDLLRHWITAQPPPRVPSRESIEPVSVRPKPDRRQSER